MANLSNLIIGDNDRVQSAYLVLQAAGSGDSSYGFSEGIHLRWDLQRTLGENHLPKGNLASTGNEDYYTEAGFNRADDFVQVFRVPYHKKYKATVDFNTDVPDATVEFGASREWHFIKSIEDTNVSTTVIIRFKDTGLYDQLRATYTPVLAALSFIQHYTGILEVEAQDKLSFAATIRIKQDTPASGRVRVETVSVRDYKTADEEAYLSKRATYNFNSSTLLPAPPDLPIVDETAFLNMKCYDEYALMVENIKYVRFDYQNEYPVIVSLETYSDFIIGASVQDESWESVGANNGLYSLSLDQNEVLNRLDNTAFNVNGHWSRFLPSNAPDPAGGPNAFKVHTANYQDKWNRADGINNGIISYLTLSTDPDNLQAVQKFSNNPSLPAEETDTFDFNYLTFLRYAALDYHIARLMGLGIIDTDGLTGATGNKKYIYLSVYHTEASLEGETAEDVAHYYMTLPTGKMDAKIPTVPSMKDLSYGMVYDKGTEVPIELTDENGYALYEPVRYINVAVDKDDLVLSLPSFFAQSTDYNFTFESDAVFYGIEYSGEKSPGVWEDYYRVPKLSVDDEYLDANGNREIIPLINGVETDVIFTHNEREQGVHRYGVYSINWFGRFSALSPFKQTDNTVFQHKCTLIPPANFAVHNIQEEDPLIFTTSHEQAMLAAMTGDKTLVRVTFEINDAHSSMYQLGNKIQFFFKQSPPQSLAGLISSVNVLSAQQADVKTKALPLISQGQVGGVYGNIDPVIEVADILKFTGSMLATPDRHFRIKEVYRDAGNGNRAGFIVDAVVENGAMEPAGDHVFVPYQNFISPEKDVKFFVAQNMTGAINWDRKLLKEIECINFSPTLFTSTGNNAGTYTPLSMARTGPDTIIYVKESIVTNTINPSVDTITFTRKVPGISVNQGAKKFSVAGDLRAELQPGTSFTIEQARILSPSTTINGSYTVVAVTFSEDKTFITVSNNLYDTPDKFIVSYNKTVAVSGADTVNKILKVKGDVTGELLLTHAEVGYLEDGEAFIVNVGGIYAPATITAVPDVTVLVDHDGNPVPDADGYEQNIPVPGTVSGVYEITFNDYTLADHPDAAVEWYNGKIRIPVSDPYSDEIKTLEVIQIKRTEVPAGEIGDIVSPLSILAYDPEFDGNNAHSVITPNPLQPRTNVVVNMHPGYRVYLKAEAADSSIAFDHTTIMPGSGAKQKQTFIGSALADTYKSCSSNITQPAIMLARKIVPPLPPKEPRGALFATRPDFYGKSTYTLDVELDSSDPERDPFALVFYRSNSSNVLATLYKTETVETLRETLANLSAADQVFINDIWYDLMNVNLDGDLFRQYPGGFRFPNPDNDRYMVPENDPVKRKKQESPFKANGSVAPGTIKPVVKQAIESAFNPLTERPLTYAQMLVGEQTRNTKPVIKDGNGEFLLPGDPAFDPCPMVVRLPITPKTLRFTDYSLDGASNEIYFYYAIEMNDQQQTSDRSPVAGPIRLVNAIAADAPVIRKITTQLANPLSGIPTAVKIEVDTYLETERIKKMRIYRTYKNLDAQSVRSMKVAKEVDYADDILEIVDDFTDEPFAPYGEILYYRIVGLREIVNERNEIEYIPSQPSKLLISNIVDVVNPPAPFLSYSRNEIVNPVRTFTDVQLTWAKTVHNGTYYVYQMTTSGNWTKIADVKTNDDVVNYTLPNDLVKVDEDGDEVYYRFRVDVVNSSGLLNLETKELTI